MAKKNGAVADRPASDTALVVYTPETARDASDLVTRTLGINDAVKDIAGETEKLMVLVGQLKVTSDAEEANADALRGKLNAALGQVNALKEQYAKPWYRLWKVVNGAFSTSESKLDFGKDAVSQLMRDHHDRKEAIAEAEAKRKRDEDAKLHAKQTVRAEKKGVAAPPAPIPAQASVPKTVGGTTYVKTWTHALTDEGKSVPREYLMVDHAKIKTAIANGMRNPDIAGVDIKQVTVPRGS